MARKQRSIQFEKDECPLLEETYYCKQNLIPQDNCTLQLLEGNTPSYCHVSEVYLLEPIAEQISTDEVLVIPTKTEKLFSRCKSDRYISIVSPVLIKIPKNCEIWAKSSKFVNDVQLTKGKPFILPKIHIDEMLPSQHYQISNITKMDFEELYKINQIARQLKPIHINTSNTVSHSVFWSTFSLLTTLLTAIVILKYKQKLRCKKTNENSSDLEENPPENSTNMKSKNHSILFDT